MLSSDILGKLMRTPGVVDARILGITEKNRVLELERGCRSSCGLGYVNKGIDGVEKKDVTAVVFSDSGFNEHSKQDLYLVDDEGTVCGRYVLPGSELTEQDNEGTWVSKDVVFYPNVPIVSNPHILIGERVFSQLGYSDGVRNATCFNPSKPVHTFLCETFGLDPKSDIGSTIVTFDLLKIPGCTV